MDAQDPAGVAVTGTDSYVWITSDLVRDLVGRYAADQLVNNDRAPLWVVATLSAYASTAHFQLYPAETAEMVLDRVRRDPALNGAVCAAYRTGATALDIIVMINDWSTT
jgi:hypothetical protein